jgi:hypothetical protein
MNYRDLIKTFLLDYNLTVLPFSQYPAITMFSDADPIILKRNLELSIQYNSIKIAIIKNITNKG